ncbi:MAG TPA: methyltransferase domain-containing protein [Terriglobales bacterium]
MNRWRWAASCRLITARIVSQPMRRLTSLELLDRGLLTADEIRANLDDLWRINRYLGGLSGNLRLLEGLCRRAGKRRVRILEVGAGDGRLARQLRRELCRRQIESEFLVLDRRLPHLQIGGRGPESEGLGPVVADVLALPFADGSFDLVTCNLLLHHFSGERALALLRNLASVARDAVVVNDTVRHWLPYALVRVMPCFGRHRVSRLDGAASVRQAYTRNELLQLGSLARCGDFEVHRTGPFQMGLVLWKTPLFPVSVLAKVEPVPVGPALGEPT